MTAVSIVIENLIAMTITAAGLAITYLACLTYLPGGGAYDGPPGPSYVPTTGRLARRRFLRRAGWPVVGSYDGQVGPS